VWKKYLKRSMWQRPGEKLVVKASLKKREEISPYCGSANLYKHGKGRTREILHTWSRGKRVYLELNLCRWKCYREFIVSLST